MGLYCDRQGERDLIQALLSVGSLLGLVLMNVISDIRGRKLALVADMIIAVISCLRTFLIIKSLLSGPTRNQLHS